MQWLCSSSDGSVKNVRPFLRFPNGRLPENVMSKGSWLATSTSPYRMHKAFRCLQVIGILADANGRDLDRVQEHTPVLIFCHILRLAWFCTFHYWPSQIQSGSRDAYSIMTPRSCHFSPLPRPSPYSSTPKELTERFVRVSEYAKTAYEGWF